MGKRPPRKWRMQGRLFTSEHQNLTYLTISNTPNCSVLPLGFTLPMGMKSMDKLTVLQANDHFRDWHTLDDERVCALCDRKFNGHDVVVSNATEEVRLRCPTPNCQSGVQHWVYPANPLSSEKSEQAWWHALGSNGETDDLGSGPSPQPI